MRLLMIPLLAALWPAGTVAAQEQNWPQWRGPDRNGVSSESDFVTQWNGADSLLWKTAVEGRGHSSPVVWGDRIFLTTDIEGEVIPGAKATVHVRGGETYRHPATLSADRKHTLKVVSLQASNGKVLWTRTSHAGRVFDNRHRRNTYASPTPATDGERVYVYFGSQGVFAYDFDGELVWRVDLGKIKTWGHGHGTSPLLYRDLLILQIDQDEGEGSFLVGLDRKTGKQIWRTERRERINYSSPILAHTNGRTELVTTSYHVVISYDPASGKELWRSEGFLGNAVPTPVANNTTVFAVSGYPGKLVRAIRIPQQGSLPEVVWEYKKGTGYTPSPLLLGDYLYLVSDKCILTCLDPDTGEVVYEGARMPAATLVKASPVGWDDRILLSGEDGDLFVVRAGPAHEVLSVLSVGETITASPALANGTIYVRGERHLFAIGN